MRAVITLLCLVALCSGCILDSYNEALRMVERYKADYGTGVSTLIIIHNALPNDLVLEDMDSCHGSFWMNSYLCYGDGIRVQLSKRNCCLDRRSRSRTVSEIFFLSKNFNYQKQL